jgi:hypothetical protein
LHRIDGCHQGSVFSNALLEPGLALGQLQLLALAQGLIVQTILLALGKLGLQAVHLKKLLLHRINLGVLGCFLLQRLELNCQSLEHLLVLENGGVQLLDCFLALLKLSFQTVVVGLAGRVRCDHL